MSVVAENADNFHEGTSDDAPELEFTVAPDELSLLDRDEDHLLTEASQENEETDDNVQSDISKSQQDDSKAIITEESSLPTESSEATAENDCSSAPPLQELYPSPVNVSEESAAAPEVLVGEPCAEKHKYVPIVFDESIDSLNEMSDQIPLTTGLCPPGEEQPNFNLSVQTKPPVDDSSGDDVIGPPGEEPITSTPVMAPDSSHWSLFQKDAIKPACTITQSPATIAPTGSADHNIYNVAGSNIYNKNNIQANTFQSPSLQQFQPVTYIQAAGYSPAMATYGGFPPVQQNFMPPPGQFGPPPVYSGPGSFRQTHSFQGPPQSPNFGQAPPSAFSYKCGPQATQNKLMSIPPSNVPALNVQPSSATTSSVLPSVDQTKVAMSKAESAKNLLYFSNINRKLSHNTCRSMLNVFGHIKYFKFQCNLSDSIAVSEVGFSTRQAALRASRLLSRLSVHGLRVTVTAGFSFAATVNLSAHEKAKDVEDMMSISMLLQADNLVYEWENTNFEKRGRTSTNTSGVFLHPVPPPKKVGKPARDVASNRTNLISIRLSSSSSTSQQVKAGGSSDSPPPPDDTSSDSGEASKDHLDLSCNQTLLRNILALSERRERTQSLLEERFKRRRRQVAAGRPKNKVYGVSLSAGLAVIRQKTVTAIRQVFSTDLAALDNVHVFETASLKTAGLMSSVISNHRLLDVRLESAVLGNAGESPELSESDIDWFKSRLLVAFKSHNEAAIDRITTSLRQGVDVYWHKVHQCPASICTDATCSGWHTGAEKRRDPRQHPYKSSRCTKSRCPSRDTCDRAHSRLESLLHPDNLRTSLCRRHADYPPLVPCYDAHLKSPDMFYHVAWSDLFVAGLHNTCLYAAGAVRNLHKLHDASGGVLVLVVSPHPVVVLDMVELLAVTAQRHQVQIKAVLSGSEDTKGAQVLVGTVLGLSRALHSSVCPPLGNVRALVLEDVSSLLDSTDQLHAAVHLMTSLHSSTRHRSESMNKVVVSQDAHEEEVAAANTLLYTEFVVVAARTGEATAACEPASAEAVLDGSQPNGSHSCSSSGERSKHSDPARNLADAVVAATSKKRRSPPSRTPDRHYREDRRKRQYLSNTSSSRDRERLSPEPVKPAAEQPFQQAEPLLTPQQFLSEEQRLQREHEEEFTVYLDMPEMHPDYEALMEEFTELSGRQLQGEDDKLWKLFWKRKLEANKDKEWQEKRKSLIEKYKAEIIEKKKQLNKPVLAISNEVKSNTLTEGDLSLEDIYEQLSEVTDELGLLGPPLLRLLRQARDAQSSSEPLAVFSSLDNLSLVRMCAEKLANMAASVPSQSQALTMQQAATVAKQLMVHAKDHQQRSETARKRLDELDLKGIAMVTLGQCPADVINLLKAAIGDDNHRYISKEDFNAVFVKISSLHYQLSLRGEEAAPEATLGHSSEASRSTTTEQNSWFVTQVSKIMSRPGINMDMFNKCLCEVFSEKPPNYEFSERDMQLACDLKELTSLNLSENMFIFALNKILQEVNA